MSPDATHSDFLVIGSGLAGLYAAIRLAEHGTVHVVTKRAIGESNTRYAQGGIAAVSARPDSVETHAADTLAVGCGLGKPEIVHDIVREGPKRIGELVAFGVAFSRGEAGDLDLGREGGHSERRVVHAEDRTGQEIQRALVAHATAHPRIRLFEDHLAVDLVLASRRTGRREVPPGEDHCEGAFVLERGSGAVRAFLAAATVLATGGAGKAYTYTSNPDIATGDGLAIAYRAGVPLANLEFVQFHPTCLYHRVARSVLITEATRGEGARLTTLDGRSFLAGWDARAELAPRDVVARAIDAELKRRGDPHVLLHLEHLPADRLIARFPQIYERCRALGLDVTREPLPVVPAAHYICGGVVTDAGARTDLPGLLAAGEVACTGMHGANRLASNSLLEAVVMSARAVRSAVAAREAHGPVRGAAAWDPGGAVRVREAIILEHDWNHVRALMWDYVGIVRSDERLRVASERIARVREAVERYFTAYLLTPDLVELRNLSLVAELIIRCASRRRESRGLHYNQDHPDPDPALAHDTVVSRREATP